MLSVRTAPRSMLIPCLLLLGVGCRPPKESRDVESGEPDTSGVDSTAPEALSSLPLDGELDVAINRAVRVRFSEPMDPASIGTFTVTDGTTPIEGVISVAGDTVTFTPTRDLPMSVLLRAEIGAGVADLAGNPLEEAYTWSFTSGESADTTAPAVVATSPSNYATDVAITRTINLYFSEPPDPATISAATFGVQVGADTLYGTVTLDGATATFTPAGLLLAGTLYEPTVTVGVLDLAGNALAGAYGWSFTTGDATGVPGAVDLQSAAEFAVLAGATVTSTGATEVTGNLGISPGSELTGFPPGLVNGTIFAGEPAAAQAELDLTWAYDDAAGRFAEPILVSGNLGGQTLGPGLYRSTGSLEISSGDLTLDGGDDADAVWIFQVATTLSTGEGRAVTLANGASAANVYWQVGSSATFATTSSMVGNILADQSISFATGASLEGRALARIGGVTLDSNVITLP